MDIIGVSNVCLTLGKTEILKHINVSFEEGKIHGLIGRNGSGKTMLMKCICCLLYTSPSPRDRSLSRMPSSA